MKKISLKPMIWGAYLLVECFVCNLDGAKQDDVTINIYFGRYAYAVPVDGLRFLMRTQLQYKLVGKIL